MEKPEGAEPALAHRCGKAGALVGKLIVLNLGSGLSGWTETPPHPQLLLQWGVGPPVSA